MNCRAGGDVEDRVKGGAVEEVRDDETRTAEEATEKGVGGDPRDGAGPPAAMADRILTGRQDLG